MELYYPQFDLNSRKKKKKCRYYRKQTRKWTSRKFLPPNWLSWRRQSKLRSSSWQLITSSCLQPTRSSQTVQRCSPSWSIALKIVKSWFPSHLLSMFQESWRTANTFLSKSALAISSKKTAMVPLNTATANQRVSKKALAKLVNLFRAKRCSFRRYRKNMRGASRQCKSKWQHLARPPPSDKSNTSAIWSAKILFA